MTRNAKRETRSALSTFGLESEREFSKAVFGSRYRLEVAARIAAAESDLVFAREVAGDLGLTDNLVHREFHKLESVGLLVRLPRPSGQQIQYYERADSCFWRLSREVKAELSGQSPKRGQGRA